MFRKERRSQHRYPVKQPASVRLQGENGREVAAVTQNVSTRGLLLRCEEAIPLRSKIEVTVRLPVGLPLEGSGEVLRVQQSSAGAAFLVAIECEAPLERFSRLT